MREAQIYILKTLKNRINYTESGGGCRLSTGGRGGTYLSREGVKNHCYAVFQLL